MERAVLLINREQRAKVTSLAAKAHVSAAEIHRRAIDSYVPDSPSQNTQAQELEQLADAVLAHHQEAMLALENAHAILKETLTVLQTGKAYRGCQ